MSGRAFTGYEIQYLTDHYPNERTDKIARHLNRPITSLYGKAAAIGLKKSAEFMASPEAGGFQKGSTAGKAFRFSKGHIPANKGKEMDAETYKKCSKTMFKKGILPHNTKKNGEISVRNNKNGTPYQWIRISKSKWELLHRFIWEKENGPIPKGFNVVFKDRNQLNCEIENLELITNAELMKRNTIHRYSPELKKSIRLINKIERYETS